jgi:hypothetical protein
MGRSPEPPHPPCPSTAFRTVIRLLPANGVCTNLIYSPHYFTKRRLQQKCKRRLQMTG